MTGAVVFFDGTLVDTTPRAKLYVPNVSQFSMAACPESGMVATFALGAKGAPSLLKLWKFPKYGPYVSCICFVVIF